MVVSAPGTEGTAITITATERWQELGPSMRQLQGSQDSSAALTSVCTRGYSYTPTFIPSTHPVAPVYGARTNLQICTQPQTYATPYGAQAQTYATSHGAQAQTYATSHSAHAQTNATS